jgi:alpha-ketoglutarate-dependent taurine dioxygenase
MNELSPSATSSSTAQGDAKPPFSVTRLDPVAGAEIHGIDLSKPISPETRDAILDAFVENHVLVFRDQDLTKDEQHAFTKNFGELEQHVGRLADGSRYPVVHTVTNIDAETGKPTPTPNTHGNYFWHTDKSYHAVPSLTTLLHAKVVPPEGGDTLFANMHMGYDALSEDEKRALTGLKAVHSWEASRRNTGNKPATEEQKRERPPVVHPVVRTHPVSGRKSLYLGMHLSHIEGMPEAEGKAMLDDLLERATVPANVYRHKWKQGDLVMWDNRCLLHRADRNFDMSVHARVLHRTVVIGTVPV